MKLIKIYFDAFKSLLNKELEINHDCIGFVGINESGKSNILMAINILNGNRKLVLSDKPKMEKTTYPRLRFLLKLTDKENKEVENIIKDWCTQNTLSSSKSIEYSDLSISYEIHHNIEKKQEERVIGINGINLEANHWVLQFDKLNDSRKIKEKDLSFPINKAIIIKDTTFLTNIKHQQNCNDISKQNKNILETESEIENISKDILLINEKLKENESQLETPEGIKSRNELQKNAEHLKSLDVQKSKLLDDQKKVRDALSNLVKDYNISEITSNAQSSIERGEKEIAHNKSEIINLQAKIVELKATNPPDDVAIADINKNIADLNAKSKQIEERRTKAPKILEDLNESLELKYSRNPEELKKHLNGILEKQIQNYMPKVVFWEHSSNYILKSETLFSDILNKKDFNEISRPLINVFRIGLGIKTFEELKSKINEIQTDGSERSRDNETLNEKINEYLRRVWKDYDQHIKINLEKDQIRIQIFDPIKKNASFYSMEERSQGCITFLSFLMTIGVEAEHHVINNTILLLDEPESHLHPSGVKYMLQQLIKIAENGNQVFYATHSPFLIDRKKFDRHIMLKKELENTIIKPSNVGRIGYFMQEEVLYNTLDIHLGSDFSSTKKYNFVFEGDGDVILYEHYYSKILNDENRPFPIELASFHQGGKCEDINKYLINRGIQLGTKWVFILDGDMPGNKLKKFIEGKYKDYIEKDIFVFQYCDGKKKNTGIELEDILTREFITETIIETAKRLEITLLPKDVEKLMSGNEHFTVFLDLIKDRFVGIDKQNEFKGKLKEVLNGKIRKALETIKDEGKFNEIFPEYLKWANDVTVKLKETILITMSNPGEIETRSKELKIPNSKPENPSHI